MDNGSNRVSRNPQSNSTAEPSTPSNISAILTPICFPVPSVHRDSLTRLAAFCCILIWHREQIQFENPQLMIFRERFYDYSDMKPAASFSDPVMPFRR